jgi:DNA-binding transcriptional LysR family regulator
METRTLNYFIAVAEEGNLSRAAIRQHISQPALTRHIKTLEEEFGALLFKRTVAGMKLTSSGEALLQHARNVQVELELAKEDVKKKHAENRPRLNVGIFSLGAFTIVPQILFLFSQSHPDFEISLHNASKPQLIEWVRHGVVQIAFDCFLPEMPDLAMELAYRESLCLAMPNDHPLAKCAAVKLSDLRDEVFIGCHDGYDARLAEYLGTAPKIRNRADSFLAALSLVDSGFGLFIAPRSSASLPLQNVTFLPLAQDPGKRFRLNCFYRPGNCSPLLNAMLETVRTFRLAHSAD